MAIRAKSADGKIHEFPDGTDPSVVDKAMKSYAGQRKAEPIVTPQGKAIESAKPDPGFLLGDVGESVSGAVEQLMQDIGEAFPSSATRAKAIEGGFGAQAKQQGKSILATGRLPLDVLNIPGSAVSGVAHATGGRALSALTGASREEANRGIDEALMGLKPGRGHVGPPAPRPGVRAGALEARNAGYVLPPEMATDEPGAVTSAAAGMAGKVKTQQQASVKNQEITNGIALKSLGLPDDVTLGPPAFRTLRDAAGKSYQEVVTALPTTTPDPQFQQVASQLGGASSLAAQHFPTLTNHPEIQNLRDALSQSPAVPTRAALDIVKQLRFNGNQNLRAPGNPEKHALGLAQRDAANAIDELIERNLTASGTPDLVDRYRAARQIIARSYDVEAATNPATGDVSARRLAALASKGKPLGGGLETSAAAANAFPKAMQNPASFGGVGDFSALDFFGAAITAGHGHPAIAAGILTRPLVRHGVLSERAQNRMVQPRASGPSVKSTVLPAASAEDELNNQSPGERALQ